MSMAGFDLREPAKRCRITLFVQSTPAQVVGYFDEFVFDFKKYTWRK